MIPIFNTEFFQLNTQEFLDEYFELLINRVTHSSMSMEKDLGNPDTSENAIRLRDNMRAFKLLIHSMDNSIDEELINKVANEINRSSMYISDGYRKFGHFIADTNIPIADPSEIQSKLVDLIQKYQTEWQTLSPYEREAKFHIEFIHIHPFEDGNGRTARLLLNYNLIKQQIAPIIITSDLLEYYEEYIQNSDIEGMSNLFRIQSLKEQKVIHSLYQEYIEQKNNSHDQIQKR